MLTGLLLLCDSVDCFLYSSEPPALGGTTNSVWGPPISIIVQEKKNGSTNFPTGKSDGGIFSLKVSSLLIIVCY